MISERWTSNNETPICDVYLRPTRKKILRRGLCCIICTSLFPLVLTAAVGVSDTDSGCRRSCLHDCALFPRNPENRERYVDMLVVEDFTE
jgi:hypothetical protein